MKFYGFPLEALAEGALRAPAPDRLVSLRGLVVPVDLDAADQRLKRHAVRLGPGKDALDQTGVDQSEAQCPAHERGIHADGLG